MFRRLLNVILNRNIVLSSTRREPLSHPRSVQARVHQDGWASLKSRGSLPRSQRRIARSMSLPEINKFVKSLPFTRLPGGVRRPLGGRGGRKQRTGSIGLWDGWGPGSGRGRVPATLLPGLSARPARVLTSVTLGSLVAIMEEWQWTCVLKIALINHQLIRRRGIRGELPGSAPSTTTGLGSFLLPSRQQHGDAAPTPAAGPTLLGDTRRPGLRRCYPRFGQ